MKWDHKITSIKQTERRKLGGGEAQKGSTPTHLVVSSEICCREAEAVKDKEERLWPQFLRPVGRMSLGDRYPGEERVPPAKAEKVGPVSVCSKNHSLSFLPGVGMYRHGEAR